MSYQIQQNDLPGPLVNSVTVTGQNANDATAPDATVTVSATVSIEISAPTGLPNTDMPPKLYLPSMHR